MANANTFAQLNNYTQGNVTSQTAFSTNLGLGTTTRALLSAEPDIAGGLIDGRPFMIRAMFKLTSGTTSTYEGSIYWNSGDNTNLTTFTDDVLIAQYTTASLASGSATLFLEAQLLWDSASEQLAGFYTGNGLSNTATPALVKSAATLTTANPITTDLVSTSALQFFVTGEFGTSNSSNVATLVEFSLSSI